MTRAVNTALAGSGGVLQVVQVTSTTQVSTSSTSMVSTGIGATITPSSASSKVLVLIQTSLNAPAGIGAGISIARGSTVIWNPCVSDVSGFYGAILNGNATRLLSFIQYLDSPSTTSPTTYNLYHASRSGGVTAVNPNDATAGGTSIILMEIAG